MNIGEKKIESACLFVSDIQALMEILYIKETWSRGLRCIKLYSFDGQIKNHGNAENLKFKR
jgi:hypothetical protein